VDKGPHRFENYNPDPRFRNRGEGPRFARKRTVKRMVRDRAGVLPNANVLGETIFCPEAWEKRARTDSVDCGILDGEQKFSTNNIHTGRLDPHAVTQRDKGGILYAHAARS